MVKFGYPIRFSAAIGHFRRTIQSIWKSYFGLIVRGLLNFCTGSTTATRRDRQSNCEVKLKSREGLDLMILRETKRIERNFQRTVIAAENGYYSVAGHNLISESCGKPQRI
jgi:hypothetical protein